MPELRGNILDVFSGEIFAGKLAIKGKKIAKIEKIGEPVQNYILPGFVDAHIHIESSMLTPSNFAMAAVPHGTVAVVADAHEIANVLGIEGVDFMISDSRGSPMKTYFAAPSCVPATPFETAGAVLSSADIVKLMQRKEIVCLGEMMNFSGVLNNDAEVMRKIDAAKKAGKPIDGHCPGLSGDALKKYNGAGISTDHECTNLAEAEEKARLGMKILVREGSSARNLESLVGVVKKYGGSMLASDDIHADDLLCGHINLLLSKAVSLGLDPAKAVRMATLNPAVHYSLGIGLLRPGDPADFVVVDNLKDFNVMEAWIDGKVVAKDGKPLFGAGNSLAKNNFSVSKRTPSDFKISASGSCQKVNCINVTEGQIFTKKTVEEFPVKDGAGLPDIRRDILKIAVACRYGNENKSAGFIKGFGLKKGAIASSVAHDSHNIIAVGVSDSEICAAVNRVIENKGGLVAVSGGKVLAEIALPVAGLMSTESAEYVSGKLQELSSAAKSLGCNLHAPFMTLSFMALPVIPELKITDKGLFDVARFGFVDVVVR